MAKKQKHVPLSLEEVAEWTTTQLMHRAYENADYWQKRCEKIAKLENPSANQQESLPWFQYHGAVWLGVANKLEELHELERQQRAAEYEKNQSKPDVLPEPSTSS